MERDEAIVRLAARAAASGEYEEALDLLDRIPSETAPAAARDLRARIHAQRGDYATAAEIWRVLLNASPEDEGVARALAAAERCRDRFLYRAWYRWRGKVVAALAVVLLACAVGFGAGRLSALPPPEGPDPVSVGLERRVSALANAVDELRHAGTQREDALLAAFDKQLAASARLVAEALQHNSEQTTTAVEDLRAETTRRQASVDTRLDAIEEAWEGAAEAREALHERQVASDAALHEALETLERAVAGADARSSERVARLDAGLEALQVLVRESARELKDDFDIRMELAQRVEALIAACEALDDAVWRRRGRREQVLADLASLEQTLARMPVSEGP